MSLHRCKYATSSITAKDAVYHWCKHAVGYAGHESLSGFVDGMAGVSGAVAEGKVAAQAIHRYLTSHAGEDA